MKTLGIVALGAWWVSSCVGSTGGEIIEFEAFAAGPAGQAAGAPYSFESPRGYSVTLTRARLHIGAVYLNQSVPTSVASDTSCFLPGIYVAEVTEGLDVDALDGALQPFPVRGFGTTDRAHTAELWLTGGPIDAEDDATIIAAVTGVAVRGAESFPFEGEITIGENRRLEPPDAGQPGARPICKQRVVTPISVEIAPTEGGRLVVRVDPAGWFSNVEFDRLEQETTAPPLYRIRDDALDQPSDNFYRGIRANAGVYAIEWEE